jgi:hypothetical protein
MVMIHQQQSSSFAAELKLLICELKYQSLFATLQFFLLQSERYFAESYNTLDRADKC